MADRNASFFGPILPQDADAPAAFTVEELAHIRARRIEADLLRTAAQEWPDTRRQTLYPWAPSTLAPAPAATLESMKSRLRIVVSN